MNAFVTPIDVWRAAFETWCKMAEIQLSLASHCLALSAQALRDEDIAKAVAERPSRVTPRVKPAQRRPKPTAADPALPALAEGPGATPISLAEARAARAADGAAVIRFGRYARAEREATAGIATI